VLQGKTKRFQQVQLASSCSTRHGRDMEQAVSTAPEQTRSRDEIVADIVLELGGAQGESLVLSENNTRDVVMSFVTMLTALDMVYRKEWSREQRTSEADYAKNFDCLLAELESKLAHPLAPSPDVQLISGIGRMREACRIQMLFRPKGGRGTSAMKRGCAGSALHLMQFFSRCPISGSAETAFPVITALLYEAATGEREASCKRACDHILRYHPH
jgi:hypothetical protein